MMKQRYLFYTVSVVAITLAVVGCNSDEGLLADNSQPSQQPGALVNGNGTGNYSEPVVVNMGDTAVITLSKECSYTDPDGTVFTCEPKTTINFYAPQDTVHVDDFESLLKIKEKLNINTNIQDLEMISDDKTINFTTMKNLQKFGIGNEWRYNITVDMAYEVYHYVNSQNETIDMAYVKTNSADCCSADAKEDLTGITPVLMSPMRVKRVASQGSDGQTASKVYDVTAMFRVDLEGGDTQPSTQSIYFEVHFVGVVQNSNASVTYRKAYEWFEPHDNLPIRCDYIVYRDSRNASGEVVTEEARSQRCSIERAPGISKAFPNVNKYTINGATIYYVGV